MERQHLWTVRAQASNAHSTIAFVPVSYHLTISGHQRNVAYEETGRIRRRQDDGQRSLRRFGARRGQARACARQAEDAARAEAGGRHARRGGLHRRRDRGAGGAGAGAPPARHVHRRHRREGAAPSLRRGDRQLHGRGGGGPRDLHRGRAGGRRASLRDGQRARHPGRSASEIPRQVGARGHHDHAARRRKVRQQGLRDIRRPARRRRLGRQRAVRPSRSRGGARSGPLQADLLARAAAGRA